MCCSTFMQLYLTQSRICCFLSFFLSFFRIYINEALCNWCVFFIKKSMIVHSHSKSIKWQIWVASATIYDWCDFPGDVNLALLRLATQSSTTPNYGATGAVDGDISTLSMTDNLDTLPWWKVQLAKPVWVTRVEIISNSFNSAYIKLLWHNLAWDFCCVYYRYIYIQPRNLLSMLTEIGVIFPL